MNMASSMNVSVTPTLLPTDQAFFNCLSLYGPMSRAEIAKQTGISRPTVSESAQRLLEKGVVIEKRRKAKNNQGRAGIVYETNANLGIILAVELDSKSIQVCVTDFAKTEILCTQHKLDKTWSQELYVSKVMNAVDSAVIRLGRPVLSMGISLAVPLNNKTGEVTPLPSCAFQISHGLNFLELFSSRFNCPVMIDNDVNWATLAEKERGIAMEYENFIYIYLSYGIGAGIYLDDRLIRGKSGLAGEVGYIQVNRDTNLQEDVRDLILTQDIHDNQKLRNNKAVVGIALIVAAVTFVVDPGLVIIGGPLSKNSNLIEAIVDAVSNHVTSPLNIRTSNMADDGIIKGVVDGTYASCLQNMGLAKSNQY